MYKLVAIDLDGTLLNSKKQISKENIEAIQCAMDKGVKIVVCSGRIFAGARIFAHQVNTKGPLIACNGAIIKDTSTNETLFSDFLTKEDCLRVADICHKEGIYFHVYVGDTMYTEKLGFSSLAYWKKNRELPEKDRVDIRLVDDINYVISSIEGLPAKIVVVSEDLHQLACCRKQVETISTVDVMSSNYDNFEVVNKGVNKANALKFLSDRLNIPREQIIAIGDNENDYSMIKFAGLGVAMGNAEETIKEISNHITLTNDENGVSEVIKKYVL